MRYILTTLGLITAGATLAATVLWLAGHLIGAAVVATITAALWLAFIVITTVAVTSWWTRETMQAGANLALQSQEINDRWDSKKMARLVSLVKEGAGLGRRQGRAIGPGPEIPALPGDDAWLPGLVEFSEAYPDEPEIIEVEPE